MLVGLGGRLYEFKITVGSKGLENYFGSFYLGAKGGEKKKNVPL